MGTQLRLFDGQSVDQFSARVSGLMDIDEEDIADFVLDDTLVMIVVATVNGVTVKKLPSGDLHRVNSLGVAGMRVASGELRDQLLEAVGLESAATDGQGRLDFKPPAELPTGGGTTEEEEEEEDEPEPRPAAAAAEAGAHQVSLKRDAILQNFLADTEARPA